MPKSITPADLTARKAALIERVKAHKILSDCADSRRVARAETLTVVSAIESARTGALRAEVQSSSGGQVYTVTFDPPKNGRIRGFSCNCRDHQGRGVVCKHMLAVSHRFIAQKRDEYRFLREIESHFFN
jgi:uncharacterized Zn finger protein